MVKPTHTLYATLFHSNHTTQPKIKFHTNIATSHLKEPSYSNFGHSARHTTTLRFLCSMVHVIIHSENMHITLYICYKSNVSKHTPRIYFTKSTKTLNINIWTFALETNEILQFLSKFDKTDTAPSNLPHVSFQVQTRWSPVTSVPFY